MQQLNVLGEILEPCSFDPLTGYYRTGCCENRGIMAHSSLTQTTVLKGAFNTDGNTKKEFFDNIKLQQEYSK
jgi:uncharacterized protein (DUF2237 family)